MVKENGMVVMSEFEFETLAKENKKYELIKRCFDYCPCITIEDVEDAWEWCYDSEEIEIDENPTLEQLDEIMDISFLTELYEIVNEHISMRICERINKVMKSKTTKK